MKLSNLLDKELHITEKKKIWFLIPAGIVVLAAIMMIIFTFTLDGPLNLGMDFAGGYTMKVQLGTKLTDSTKQDYKNMVTDIAEGLTNDQGEKYGIKLSGIQEQGSGDQASLYIKYKAVASEETMEDEINPALKQSLQESIFKSIPVVTVNGGSVTATYSAPLVEKIFETVEQSVRAHLSEGVSVSAVTLSEDRKAITVQTSASGWSEEQIEGLKSAMSYNDTYSGLVSDGDIVSATVSGELLTTAIAAIVLAIVLMLAYIAIRFELSSGFAAIVALFHDILMMFCFMAIFHVEINSTFIAALITILGYSINNTIIIFDRVRETVKTQTGKMLTGARIANEAVGDTLMRSFNTTLTTLITIGMVAIIGVPDIRIFALPIIAGLLAGTFSSIFIAPSIWALIRDRKRTKKDKVQTDKKAAVAE